MYLRWDDHIDKYQNEEIKSLMKTEGKRNNKAMNLLHGMRNHWVSVHSELRTTHLLTKVEGDCQEEE
eukprot:3277546-Ditylum_brightwellii.AAC.1